MKFKSDIQAQAGFRDGDDDIGAAGQLLSSTGSITNWIDQGDIVAGETDKAKSVILRVKNSTASAMSKGQVVCEAVSATPPSGNLIEVALADNNGTNTMPALGILNEDLDAAGGANDEGDAIMFGKVSGIDTSAFSVGDEVFVDDTPGGLTTTKPTGVKYIQKVGVVIRDNASNGTIEVFGAGRVNDVPTPLYIDHTNQRLGIGTTSPTHKLQVVGNGAFNSTLDVQDPDVSSNGLLRLSHDSTGSSLYSNPASSNVSAVVLRLGINNSEKMRIANNGNVGIGTTNPAFPLHVNTGNDVVGYFKSADNKASIIIADNDTTGYVSAENSRVSIGYGNGVSTSNITIVSGTYNVGIGTTSPSEKLVVFGNTNITNNLYVGFGNTLKTCTYPAQYSLAVGSSNSLGGFANGIIGVSNSIDCTSEPWLNLGGNFIAGLNNNIFGGYSHANAVFGQLNELGTSSINNANTLIGGSEHEVTSDNALLFGKQCRAFGATYSLTGGFDSNNFGGFGSIAIGAGATASTGNNQYAFGTGVTTPTSASAAYGPDQFVVGKFNVYSTGGRVHRFAVGNGSYDFSRSNALNVDSFGRTGLGVTAPSYQLQLSLNSAAKPTSSSWTVVSDERVKTNIQDYTTGLTEILQINPKTFDYNGKAGFEETTGNIGIIAQDVQGIMPETINTYEAKLNEDDAEETELFNFDSHPIQFALINAVKELNAKVEALEARIQTLEEN